jgi:hypothetical protein
MTCRIGTEFQLLRYNIQGVSCVVDIPGEDDFLRLCYQEVPINMDPTLNSYCAMGIFNSRKRTPVNRTDFHNSRSGILPTLRDLKQPARQVKEFHAYLRTFTRRIHNREGRSVVAEGGIFEILL